jgi:mannosyltransferase OCH1-like enzyme
METPTKYNDIPKLIHMIWLGPFPYPNEWMYTWKPFCENFGWTLKLWREKDIEDFGLTNKKQFNESISYQQKSDIARYEIVYRLGGMYLDCDMVYLGNNIENFLPLSCKMFIGVIESPSVSLNKTIGAPYLSNGWFVAPPKRAILKRCIDLIPERVRLNTKHTFIKTGPTLLNMSVQEPIITIPTNWIFPKDFHKVHNVPDISIFKKTSLIFTYNGAEYPHMKKLKKLKESGKCNGDDCSKHF